MPVIALALALTLGLFVAPLGADAQETTRPARIGYLATGGNFPQPTEAFRQGLHELGYVEGRNFLTEYRSAEGKLERLPALASELIALKVDIIVAAGGTNAALAAKQATKTIRLVFPAGTAPERAEKDMLKEADLAAGALGLRLHVVKVRGPEDFPRR
jgi:ABC-type uncharacterized transport system substrate-binding protein